MLDRERLNEDCRNLFTKARIALIEERNYQKSYDLGTQAEFLCKNYLTEDLVLTLEVLIYKGLALLGLDKDKGHRYLEEIYYNYRTKVNLIDTESNNIKLKLKSGFAQAKSYIGEYRESIDLLSELIRDTWNRIETLKHNNQPYDNQIITIIKSNIRIAYSLIFLHREIHYPGIVSKTQTELRKISNIGEIELNELAKKVDISLYDKEVNCELAEATRYVNDSERLALKYGFTDLVSLCQLYRAYVYVEKEEYKNALEQLLELSKVDFIKQNFLGYVLNELAICKINLGELSEIENILKESWDWLSENNYHDELPRTCYAFALFHFKQGNLLNSYSYADLAFNTDKDDLPIIRLLYQITFVKYISANRQGIESDYVYFRSEYDKYKAQLERRG